MPSATHQALVALLCEHPDLLMAVLAPVVDLGLPARIHVRPAPGQFTDLQPPSYHADLVLRIEDERGRLLHLFIVEIQLRRDRRKRISWPIYVTSARAQIGARCRLTLVVLAPDPALAAWCAQPIELDTNGSVLRPLVLGPSIIPKVLDAERARAHPELAVLSAVVHARAAEASQIATAALMACGTLDSGQASLYADLVVAQLDTVARRAVEKLMEIQGYRLQTAFARRHFAAGRKEGLQEGAKEALAQMLTLQLEQQFGPLPSEAARAVEAADMKTLLAWGTRVLAAGSLDEVLARPARRRAGTGRAAGTRTRQRAK
jgi:hypothetical protein